MRPAAIAAAALLALAPAAVQAQGPMVEVRNAWVALPPNGSTTAAGFLEAVNAGKSSDRLVGASCTCAARVEIHQMSMAGGVMRMRPVPGGLVIEPSGVLRLEPRGTHLMLLGLKAPLRPGERVPLTLEFARAGRMTVEAWVEAPPPMGAMPGMR